MEIIRTVLHSLGFDPAIFLSQMALFFVMHALLGPILYRPLEAARNERDELTWGKIHEAERVNNEALELKARYEAELRKAHQEAQAQLLRASREVEAARAGRIAQARLEAESVVREAQREIQEERARAEAELQGGIPALSLAVAARLVEGAASELHRDRLTARLREAS